MTDQELEDYYTNLLIVQYFTLLRARGTIATFVREIIASQIIQAVEDGFDVATAIGVQLDAVATYRGAQRNVVGLDLTRDTFDMPTYSDSETGKFGFAQYIDGNPSWFFLRYADVDANIYTMNDSELRRLVELKAKLQSSQFGIGEIDLILYEFFQNNATLIDNGDMTIVYQGNAADTDTLFSIVTETKSLPQPAGVQVSYTTV